MPSETHSPPGRCQGGVRSALAGMGRYPRKRFGQHFLADPGIAEKIVGLARLSGTERVVEIGPGLGALTERLIRGARELWLIEVDADLAARLRDRYGAQPQVHVVEADVLRVDMAHLLGPGAPPVVVANLPYNIATAVLAALLDRPHGVARMVLMLQREVAARLYAVPGSKEYGTLSVLTQLAARVRPALRVAPGAFVPRPKVVSEVVLVEPHAQPPVRVADRATFKRLVRAVFTQRRKQLRNSMRLLCRDAEAVLCQARIDPMRRPETLTLAEFAALSDALN